MKIRDGEWTLAEWDAATGRTVWALFDGARTVMRIDYPVEAVVKANTAERNGDKPRGEWRKLASVPHNVLHASGLDDAIGQGDRRFVARWLNSSDNRAWRTSDARA